MPDDDRLTASRHFDGMNVSPPKTTVAAICFVALIVIAGVAGWRAMERRHVSTMLNIATLPASVTDIACASFGFSDVLERCTFRAASSDISALLRGYRFHTTRSCSSAGPGVGGPCLETTGPETSHNYCCGPAIGPDFPISHIYVAEPKEFDHGGMVTLLTDKSRTRVMVDLYIE
ncbi:hypothetical protein [Sphingomonas yabuuchiae]|uniref:Uncharacterized protein n=2 Tax=Sphingomonas yabuuchiae TaxID=172044 RepID=A0ABR6KFB6_9SPHN|nr:hypothetical protein [Sphingomonas yabuuchiae]MBB4611186.1 hypothetical protein [Sphingomonas yabuuchiae]